MKTKYLLLTLSVFLFSCYQAAAQCGIAIGPSTVTICSGKSITLLVSDTATSNSNPFLWSPAAGLNVTTGTSVIATPTATTTYTVTKLNCPDKDSIMVIVNPLPIVTITITENSGKINNDGILCSGDSAILDAGVFTSYLWSNGFTSQTINAKTTGNYTVTVTDINGCSASQSVAITVNPLPNPVISINENSGNNTNDGILCSGDSANLSVGNYASYLWSTGATINNVDVNTAGNYTVLVINGKGCKANTAATIVVNNLPAATITSPAGICTGLPDSVTFTGTAGTPPFTFTYTKNGGGNLFATTITGNIVKVAITTTVANISTYVLKSVADANGCSQNQQDTAITIVSDAPTLNQKANRVACNGTITPLVNFNGAPAGSTVSWTCSADIGFGTSGTGNIAASTLINLTALPIIATITATASVSNCNGIPMTFTITVNPTPQVSSIINQSFCNGDTIVNGIPFSSLTLGATFSWTGTKNIGFGVSGNNSIPGFAAVNSTNNPLVTLITISITANNCQGPDSTFTVTVNPTPFANSLTDTTYCNGTAATAINFSSPTAGATFSWASNFDVGFGTSNTGSISAYTAKNLLFYPVTATVIVSTSINNCTGTDSLFSITVNPTPKVFVSNYDTIYCGGNTVPPIFFSSTSPDSVIHWSINNYNVGLLVDSGINQIPSFIASDTASTQLTTLVTYFATTLQGCTGNIEKFKLKVKPSPVVNQLSSITVCNNEQVNLPDFTSPTDSVNFIWIGSTNIGFGTYGSGSIPSFTAINLDTVPIYDTIAVSAEKECTGADIMEFVIVVNPSPKVNPVNNFVVCDSSDFSYTFTSPIDSVVYEWTNSNTNSGLPANGIGNIPVTTLSNLTNGVIQSDITVTPYYKVNGNCAGDTMQFKIFVSPKPEVSTLLKDTVFCNGQLINLQLSGNIPNAFYTWSNSNTAIGLAAFGIGDTLSFISTNNSSVPQVGTIIVKPNYNLNGFICEGDSFAFEIKINPTPDINTIADINLCSGESFTDIIFNGNVPPSVFKWTNDNTNSGLVASGNDTIYGQVLTNSSLNKIVSTITATPYYLDTNGCIGNSKTFTITVNPVPNLSGTLPVTDTTFCNNVVAIIPLIGSVSNSSYNWTNSNTNIGLSLGSGAGDSLSFTTNNSSIFPDSTQIWVYSSFTNNGKTCNGDSATFKVFVNPTPTIFPVSNITLCNAEIDTILFSGLVPGTLYSWTNSNTNIGISASGSGDSLIFTASNASISATDSATILVNTSYTFNNKTCNGNSISFKIFVNPVAVITSTQTNPVVCNGDTILLPPFSNSLGNNAIINWTNQGPYLGLSSAGTGNIAPFKSVNNGNTILKDTIFVAATTNGCKGPDSTFIITVNPTPSILTITDKTYCNGDTVPEITFNCTVLNASYTWSSSVNFGGIDTSGTSSFYPSFIAVNTTAQPKVYTVKTIAIANGCSSDTAIFTITINPSPKLINSIIDSICDGTALSYSAISSVPGTSYNWVRYPVPGITNPYNSVPSSLITEVLLNSTTSNINVVYEFTLVANGCTSIVNETTTVKPSPRINLVSDKVFCNGSTMPEILLSSTPPADTVYWVCSNSIGYDASSGSGNMPIDTALNNNPFGISAIVYLEAITNGCYGKGPDSVFKITVNPSPASPQFSSIVTAPNPISLCGGSQNINFNINNPLTSNGITYLWNVNNLSVATIASPNNPNTVISFNNTSDTIIVSAAAFNTALNGSCAATVSQQVILNQNNSNSINEQKIILKQPGNLLVYPDNSMANDSGYQWGYDLKILDTLLGPPQSIFNQRYQIFTPDSKFIIDTLTKIQLDTFKYCFWVLVKKGDCQSKVYYNGPYKNKPAIVINNTSDVAIAITPNPAAEYFDFTLSGKIYGNIQLKISNGLGQQIFQSNFVKKEAELTQRVMLNNLQNGIYHLELFSSDQQSISTKIVVYH